MKEGQKYLLAFLVVAVVALVVGVAYYYLQPVFPPPTPPGPEPEVTVQTDVVVTRSLWFGYTYIESVQNRIMSQPYYKQDVGIAVLPFKGTLVLTVVYPSNQMVTVGSQKIVVELGSSIVVTFFWKTKQSGDHVVTASLYDENGVLVDQKSVLFYVPPR